MTTTVRYLTAFKGKSPGDTEALADEVATAYVDGGLARLASDNDNSASATSNVTSARIAAVETKLAAVATNYADDAAAATGGVAVGSLYNTTGAVKVRAA